MSQNSYSSHYGLQAGPVRQAGIMAIFERVIDYLYDKIGSLTVNVGGTLDVLDLSDRITLEYPDEIMRLPHVALSLVSEAAREPGIGRVMVDGDGSQIGFTKILQFYFDIWARTSLERVLVSDAIVYALNAGWKYFRQFGIRDIKHVGTQSRNYEQESSALYQRMTVQQASRVFRQILQYEVDFDLVTDYAEDVEIIERIVIESAVEGYLITDEITSVTEIIGGLTELILDKRLMPDVFKEVDITW